MLSSRCRLSCTSVLIAIVSACTSPTENGIIASTPIASRSAVVGVPVSIDLATAFADRRQQGLTYLATFDPSTTTLALAGASIAGTPQTTGVIRIHVIATDAEGDTASQRFSVVVFAAGLTTPNLPTVSFVYSDVQRPLPPQYLNPGPGGLPASTLSNTPLTNLVTNAGATLGRVLFHDPRLSANDRVSCASCHRQEFGFSDTAQFSTGFRGEKTTRHSMALANSRFYPSGRFFWDERAPTLEAQTLNPIPNPIEMGLPLADLAPKLRVTSYYPPLFQAAFGSPEVTNERVSLALAQYIRSIISYGSRFDSAFAPGGVGPNLTQLSADEQQGFALFNGAARCNTCHVSNAQVSTITHNTGLDATITDIGAGNGKFKAPSLRNVAVRGRFMHDGRFTSLEQVVAFYDSGVQANPGLDGIMRGPGGTPQRLNLTAAQRNAIVAYLRSLTDGALMTDPRFSNPFPPTQ